MRTHRLIVSVFCFSLFLTGCGSDKKGNSVAPDTSPPTAVTDLTVLSTTDSSVVLGWTAPGDDGDEGTAEAYEVRVDTVSISGTNWASATEVEGEPVPQIAGSAETLEVVLAESAPRGPTLSSSSPTFYFCLRTRDEAENWSELSNVVSAQLEEEPTEDTTAPAPITDLTLVSQTDTTAVISWTAPGDDENTGTAWEYDIRLHTEVITYSNWHSATQVTGEVAPQAAGTLQSMEVDLLASAESMGSLAAEDAVTYIAIRTWDESENLSQLSNSLSVVVEAKAVVTIPDANLLAAVRSALGIPSGDITVEDMQSLANLTAMNQGIADLTGLEYATNLTELNLKENQITDLAPLAGLTMLTALYVHHNLFNSVEPLQNLVDMESLNINDNFVTDLSDLAGMTKLKTLRVDENENLEDISVLVNFSDLETFEAYKTAVEDISAVSGLSRLSWLNLGQSQVEDLSPLVANGDFADGDHVDLFKCPLSHQSLDVHLPALEARSVNVVMGSDMWAPPAVQDLAIVAITDTSMTLTWTSPGGSSWTDASYYYMRYNTYAITEENWSSANSISGAPTPSPYGQTETWVIDFQPLKPVQGIDYTYYLALVSEDAGFHKSSISNVVSGQLIDVTPPGKVETLEVATFTGTSITLEWLAPGDNGFSGAATAYEIRYSTSPITDGNWASASIVANALDPQGAWNKETFEVTGLTSGVRYYLALKAKDDADNWSELSQVVSAVPLEDSAVNIPDANLEAAIRDQLDIPTGDITALDMAELTYLYARNEGISSLAGLETASNLSHLNVEKNSIVDLGPLSNLLDLNDLRIADNSITDLSPLEDLVGLEWLIAYRNSIASVTALADLTELQYLHLSGNAITDLTGLENKTQLGTLDLGNNPISDLTPISGNTALEGLYINNSNVSNIGPLSALTSLRHLYFGDCNVSNIDALAALSSLETLSLNNNSVTDISALTGKPALYEVYLSTNNISDISALSGATSLRVVWLYENSISDLSPLSGLTNMEQISFNENNISDLSPLSGLTKMQRFFGSANSYSDISVLANMPDLEECSIAATNVSNLSALSGLTKLEELYITNTPVTDIGPLAGVTSLTRLFCSSTSVTDISAVEGLVNLAYFDLGYSSVSDLLPVVNNASFAEGDVLDVYGCPLSATSTSTHIPTLEARGVTVYH